jgi:putative transposase
VGQVFNLPQYETMNTLEYKKQYRRRLPHIHPLGATFFITFRLADSIPREVWKELRERLALIYSELADESVGEPASVLEREHLWFQEYEERLHNTRDGPFWLKDERIAALVAEAFHHLDGDRYRLDAFCVMPNHTHVVLMPLPTTESGKEACLNHQLVNDREGNLGYLVEDENGQRQFVAITFHSLASIMHSIKRHTALKANRLLGRSDAFWQDESYDHYTRDHEEWLRTIRYVLNNPIKAGFVKEWQEWRWNWRRTDAVGQVGNLPHTADNKAGRRAGWKPAPQEKL